MLDKNKMNLKVAFVSSSGGHFEQLKMLKSLMKKYDSFLVTEKTNFNNSIAGIKTYYLPQINRKEMMFIFTFFAIWIKSIRILALEKPDIIISTGALSTIPITLLGKIFKVKVIYFESFSKINSPTKTGKLVYAFADVFYVQWEEMLKIYPKARYKGKIY